jgi:probable HAF family extracellular repeat protein
MKKPLIAVALVLATVAVQPTVADSGYTLTLIPTLGGCCSQAAAINASGLVVGNAQLSGNEGFRAFLWDGVTLTTLPGLGPGLSSATAINGTGLIAGASAAPITTTQRATLWTNLIPQGLATLQTSGASQVHGMNAAGQMAGNAASGTFPTAVTRAVFWPTTSQVVALPDAAGAFNIATAVNLDSAAGMVQLSASDFHAALWTTINATPQFTDINPFGGSFSRANAMNAAGMIAGQANSPNQTSSQVHAVIWNPDLSVTDLHFLLPDLAFSLASGINNAGQVVGTMFNTKGSRAFLYSGGVMIDLNDLIPPGSNWILDRGSAINDAGTIVGVARSVDGTMQRGFVLTPNSPAGNAVVAQPIDEGTGTSPVTLTFDQVTSGGATTLTISNTGPNPPEGFSLGDPPTYYDLFTSALYIDDIKICIDYSTVSYSTPSALRLFHYENDVWVDVTTSLDTANETICGEVTSLSPFAIFQRARERAADGLGGRTVLCRRRRFRHGHSERQ